MDPWTDHLPSYYLPEPQFFSRSHTEDDLDDDLGGEHEEILYVDGEWDMPDFSRFYGAYSDVYYFLASANEYVDDNTPIGLKNSIANAFKDKAFKGGFSYVNFYVSLAANRERAQRLRVDKIKKESPGYMNIVGEQEIFTESHKIIDDFLDNRKGARVLYNNLHKFLSKLGFLQMAGHNFPYNDPASESIMRQAHLLAETLNLPNADAIVQLVDNNALVFAKLILSLHRRLEETSKFFAQGRVMFSVQPL